MSVVEYIYDPGGPRPSNCGVLQISRHYVTEGTRQRQGVLPSVHHKNGRYEISSNKSQRKVVKRLHRYLREGKGSSGAVDAESDMSTDVSPKKSRLSSPDSEEQGSRTTTRSGQTREREPTPRSLNAAKLRTSGGRKNGLLKMAKTPRTACTSWRSNCSKSWPRTAEISATFASSYAVFKKFQSIVHLDDHNCDEKHYSDFIVESPLVREPGPRKPGTGDPMPCDYGSYHQPVLARRQPGSCRLVSTPPSGRLRLSASWANGLQEQYGSAELLCPVTLRYMPIEKCLPKLEVNKYCKLGEGEAEEEEALDIDALTVYREMLPMPYREYRTQYGDRTVNMLREYGKVMGSKVGRRDESQT
eukprot:Em0544g3a